MSETIIINIDDSELELVLLKLETISDLTKDVFGGGTGGGGRGKGLGTVLPGINRELRLILGQVPGMRQAMQAYFMVTRGERAYRKFVSPDITPLAGTAAVMLTIVATLIILAQKYQQLLKQQEREAEQFMRFVMKRRRFSEEEFKRQKTIMKYQLKGQPT